MPEKNTPPSRSKPLEPNSHLQHPLQRRPHRRQPLSPKSNRLQNLCSRHRAILYQIPPSGTILPIRRLSLQRSKTQIPNGPRKRRLRTYNRLPAPRLYPHPPARTFLSHDRLSNPRQCNLPSRLPIQQRNPGQIPDHLHLRHRRLPKHPGTSKKHESQTLHPRPRRSHRPHLPSGPIQHRQSPRDSRKNHPSLRSPPHLRTNPTASIHRLQPKNELRTIRSSRKHRPLLPIMAQRHPKTRNHLRKQPTTLETNTPIKNPPLKVAARQH